MEQEVLRILRDLNDEIPDDVQANLLEKRIIDSFDIVNFISALEEHFGIEIPVEEIVPENFGDVRSMTALIAKYLHGEHNGKE